MKQKISFKFFFVMLAVLVAFSVMPSAAQASARANFQISTAQIEYPQSSSDAIALLQISGMYMDRCAYRMKSVQTVKGTAINVTFSAVKLGKANCAQVPVPFTHEARINVAPLVKKNDVPYTITVNITNPVESSPKTFSFTVSRECPSYGIPGRPAGPNKGCLYFFRGIGS